MLLKKLAARAALLAGLALFAAQAALAQGFVSIKGDVVNVRERPTTRSTVLWELTDGYPLRVTRKTRNWVKVRDFEGDLGWVSRKLVDRDPHHIVKAKIANLRSKPSVRSRILGKLERYELLKTLGRKGSWIQVQRNDGQRGWVSRKLVWGW